MVHLVKSGWLVEPHCVVSQSYRITVIIIEKTWDLKGSLGRESPIYRAIGRLIAVKTLEFNLLLGTTAKQKTELMLMMLMCSCPKCSYK